MKSNDNLLKTNSSNNTEELRNNYDRWAKKYERDLVVDRGYKVPEFAVKLFSSFVPKNARTLDVGSGTGIVGKLLIEEGYQEIEALDLSEGMLNEARSKHIYQAYHLEVLGEELRLLTDTYDAIIAVGTFGPTHAPPHAFDELIRIAKRGAYIVFTMRENEIPEKGEFREKLANLENSGWWVLERESNHFQGYTKRDDHLYFKSFIYKTL